MGQKNELSPYDFSHQGSVSDPQLSSDGRYATYIKRAAGRSSIVWVELDAKLTKLVRDAPVRSAHPFGGGVSQLSGDGKTLYIVTVSGGIARMDLASGDLRTVYEGPGVSQISLSGNGARIAAAVFGDRVAVFDAAGMADPIVVSERTRELKSFSGLPSGSGYFLAERPDFVFDVSISPNGNLVAWHEWALPYMSWQRSQIAYLELGGPADVQPSISVCAGGDCFVSQPRFSPDGKRLGFLAESHSYLRLWTADLENWTAKLVVDESLEHGGVPWGNGNRTFDFSADGRRIFFSRNEAGFGRLLLADLETPVPVEIAKAHHFGVKSSQHSLIAVRSGAKTPNVIVTYDLATLERREIERAYSEKFYSAIAVEPIANTARHSTALYSFVKPTFRAELADLDPIDVPYRLYRAEGGAEPVGTVATFHGGPTDQALVTYSTRIIAFLQAGYQVLVFDYRGSTGWGRSFRNALDYGFGIAEVVDLLSVLADLVAKGLAKPGSIVVNGGSSGGYSALRSLCLTKGLFCGGIAEYPLINLADSVASTHRFESRYFDRLVGVLPAQIELYRERSVSAGELDDVPILVMHGDSDTVVNHRQVLGFVDEAKTLGRAVEFALFEGEGHGFSSPEAVEKEFLAYQRFLAQIAVGIGPYSS